jgi:hypothetical protein
VTNSPPPIARLRTLSWSLLAGPLAFLAVSWFVLGPDELSGAPGWALPVLVALSASTLVLASALGYRVAAIAPTTDADQTASRAILAFQTGMLLRLALSELPAIAGLVLGFVVADGGFGLALLGCAVALAGMVYHGVPSERAVRKVTEGLEAQGTRVPLRAILHGEPY